MEFPPQPPPGDSALIDLLNSRRDKATFVHLQDGRVLEVFDIAWGYDPGEATAHITTNCSPPRADRPIDLIGSSEIFKVIDPDSGSELFLRDARAFDWGIVIFWDRGFEVPGVLTDG